MGTRYIAVGKETVLGTEVAATRYDNQAEADIEADQGWIIPEPVDDRSYKKRNLGSFLNSGAINLDVCTEGIIGELLMGLFGTDTKTNPATGAYAHLFSRAAEQPSYSLRIGVDLRERLMTGMLVDALTLQFQPGQDLKAKADVLSGFVESHGSLGSPSFSELQNLTMSNAGGFVKFSGTDKTNKVHAAEVTLRNNFRRDARDLSGRTLSAKRAGVFSALGELTMFFEEYLEYNKFISGTEFTLLLYSKGAQIGSTGYYHGLEVEYRKCVYKKGALPLKKQTEGSVFKAPFQAFYDSSGGFNAEAKVTLTNTVSADY